LGALGDAQVQRAARRDLRRMRDDEQLDAAPEARESLADRRGGGAADALLEPPAAPARRRGARA
ncbi:MAG: hypothetical protein ACKOUS_12410, partial [Alphaproteobacteria bacterium]